jgi:spore coat protein U-like protein
MKVRSRSLLFALLLIGAMPAHAFCGVSATGVNFGSYNPLIGGNIDSTGSVTIMCDGLFIDERYTIGLSAGSWGSVSVRQMANVSLSSERIPYRFYKPNGNNACSYSSNWGLNGNDTVRGRLRGFFQATRSYYICGRATGGLDVAVGQYSDTVTVEVNF